jgi:hypothetical protein
LHMHWIASRSSPAGLARFRLHSIVALSCRITSGMAGPLKSKRSTLSCGNDLNLFAEALERLLHIKSRFQLLGKLQRRIGSDIAMQLIDDHHLYELIHGWLGQRALVEGRASTWSNRVASSSERITCVP